MSANVDLAKRICEGWTEMTADDWQNISTTDIKYQNMPWPDHGATGFQDVYASLKPFIDDYDVSSAIICAAAEGDLVFVERVETLVSKADADVRCTFPCAGVFRFRDGKLCEWRDYFDGQPLIDMMRR